MTAPIKCLQWGETALHCAASEGHPEVVRTLLSAGALPDIRDKVGKVRRERE